MNGGRFELKFYCFLICLLLNLDAIRDNKENSVVLDSDDLSISSFAEINTHNLNLKSADNQPRIQSSTACVEKQKNCNSRFKLSRTENVGGQPHSKSFNNLNKIQSSICQPMKLTTPKTLPDKPKLVLIGFLYVSQAEFTREVLNSYISCNLFGEDEIVNSKLTAFNSKSVYNFNQVGLINLKVPLESKLCYCEI